MTAPLALQLPDDLLDEIARRAADLLAERTARPEPWLSVAGAAEHLGYNGNVERGKRRVYDLVSRGELHPKRDGTRLVFRPSDIDNYLQEHA